MRNEKRFFRPKFCFSCRMCPTPAVALPWSVPAYGVRREGQRKGPLSTELPPQFSAEIVFSTPDSLYISHFSKRRKDFFFLIERVCDGDVYSLWKAWRKSPCFML